MNEFVHAKKPLDSNSIKKNKAIVFQMYRFNAQKTNRIPLCVNYSSISLFPLRTPRLCSAKMNTEHANAHYTKAK